MHNSACICLLYSFCLNLFRPIFRCSRVLYDSVGLERRHQDVDEPEEEQEDAAHVSSSWSATELSTNKRSSRDQHNVADNGHAEENDDRESKWSCPYLIAFAKSIIDPID